MNPDLVGSIILLAVCLFLSFLCSAAETAMTAAGKTKLRSLQNANPERRTVLTWLEDHLQRALTATLIGNNIVNIAASAVATIVCTQFFGGRLGPLIAVVAMATIVVIFCEILPKNIAIAAKEKVIMVTLPFVRLMSFIFAPVIFVVQRFVWLLCRLFGVQLDTFSSFITREDLEMIVSESEESGALEEEERKMISGVISFEETRVSEIMLARPDMTTVSSDMSVRDAASVFVGSGHSRIPLHENDLDRITGVLYVKDLLAPMSEGRLDAPVRLYQREPMFVPETIKTDEAFELMKRSKTHLAIVVDEYGSTAGLITLEDLIEEIVGDIQDEYDDEMPDVMEERSGVYIVQGYVNLEDLSDELGYYFDFDDVDTVAGMMLSIKGNFPARGESVAYGPWRLTATQIEGHRIMQVRIERTEEASDDSEEVV